MNARHNPLRPDFTVVELLVVVSLIVLLLALLLPALGNTRRWARTMVCLNNHRQLLMATSSYATDNDDYMPFTNWLANDGYWRDLGGAGWLYKYPAAYPNPFTEEHREGGAIWEYLQEGDVYHCPVDVGQRMGPSHYITSYLMNGAICGWSRKPPSYRRTQFRSDAVVFWEPQERAMTNDYNDGSSRPNEGITQRHHDGLVLGSIDGQANRVSWDEYLGLLGEDPGPLWCDPQ